MAVFQDQLGRSLTINEPPKRIVSVVPSQTEFLYHLGLEQEVIGITKFCIHPNEWFRNKTRIGGTKDLKLEKIAALQPDLIIANKEENSQADIEWLADRFPVWISDIYNLDDALHMMSSIGEICHQAEKAQEIIHSIRQSFDNLNPLPKGTALYFIWRAPYMAAGSDTFINDMLMRSGFENVAHGRYPEYSMEVIQHTDHDYILLSSEPYPFKEKHMEELQQLCPNATIQLVNGEYFSWYGSRLLGAVDYFKSL